MSNVPFRWKVLAGYVSDYQTGLVYCWHRYYDPKIGRWISRDPIGLEGWVNTYAYCSGNPVQYVDPSGLIQIELRFRDALPGLVETFLGFSRKGWHAYLWIRDNDPKSKTYGHEWTINGSPTNLGATASGPIIMEYGPFGENLGNFDWGGNQGNRFEIVNDSSSYYLWQKLLVSAAESFLGRQTEYGALRSNSNSFMRELLSRTSLAVEVDKHVPKGWFGEPNFGQWVPGWENYNWENYVWASPNTMKGIWYFPNDHPWYKKGQRWGQ